MIRVLKLVAVLLAVVVLSGCGIASAPAAGPPMQVRCIMAERDQAMLFVFKSSPSTVEQSAITENCIANGRMGPTWAPLPITTAIDNYTLICEGVITGQTSGAIMVRSPSDAHVTGRAYDACHALTRPVYPS